MLASLVAHPSGTEPRVPPRQTRLPRVLWVGMYGKGVRQGMCGWKGEQMCGGCLWVNATHETSSKMIIASKAKAFLAFLVALLQAGHSCFHNQEKQEQLDTITIKSIVRWWCVCPCDTRGVDTEARGHANSTSYVALFRYPSPTTDLFVVPVNVPGPESVHFPFYLTSKCFSQHQPGQGRVEWRYTTMQSNRLPRPIPVNALPLCSGTSQL